MCFWDQDFIVEDSLLSGLPEAVKAEIRDNLFCDCNFCLSIMEMRKNEIV